MKYGLLLYALASSALVSAQQFTDLSGWIRDPTDAAVSGAWVSVVNEETGFRRVTESQSDGGYVVASLHPGVYKVTVRKDGFRTTIRFGVKLDVGQPARVDFSLSLGSMQETVTVEGAPALLNTEDASVATLILRDRIERLPLNGRGLLSLLELAPGALITPATRGEAGQFTASGQRPNTHSFTVDGVSVNSGVGGGGSAAAVQGGSLPGLTALGSMHGMISLEALDEFRVQTATPAPEFGRLPGAQVTLSSRAGSNDVHGSLSYYFRHERLDANDWFANRAGLDRAPMRMHDFGASLGGPVKRNRTFFFLSYEGLRLRQPFAWRSAVPTREGRESAPEWARTFLNLFPLPNGGPLEQDLAEWTGRNQRPSKLDAGSVRIDHALTDRLTLFGRYHEAPSANEFGSSQINELEISSRGVTLGANLRIRPALVADVRGGYSLASAASLWRPAGLPALASCQLEAVPAFLLRQTGLCDYLYRFSVAGVGQLVFGRESDRRQTQWHLLPALSWTRGAHQMRFGGDYRRLAPSRNDRSPVLSLIADSYADLIANRNMWIATSGALDASSLLEEISAFAQDTWRIHPRLTASYGLRWEFSPAPSLNLSEGRADPLPAYLFDSQTQLWPPSYRNFAPRAGLAWRPFSAGHTVLRGGFGLYFDSSLSVGADLVNRGPFTLAQFNSPRNAPFPTLLSYGFAPGLQMPGVRQWSVTLEHAFAGREVFSAGYVGSSGANLLRREIGGPPGDERFQLALATNHGLSGYHGLQIQYRRRFGERWQALASYSWAHSIDNSSSDAALYWAGSGLTARSDRGASDFDARQSFSAGFTVQAPRPLRASKWSALLSSWSLDGIARARSGFPITVLSAEHTMGLNLANAFRPERVGVEPVWLADVSAPGGRVLNRAAFRPLAGLLQGSTGRNSISGFGMSQIDLALRRDFPRSERRSLHFRIEAFNLLNHPNFADPIRFLSSSLFGQSPSMLNLMLGTGSPGSGLTPVLQTGGPRSVQLVLRYRF
ncbi:MAG: TonB-dependent receptor [Acidobacteria bacterium]|nr:TonB-dependent receptor [Acidobacteriota bacterium]